MKGLGVYAGTGTRAALLISACLALLGILATAPGAGAQSATDQYIPRPDKGGVVDTGTGAGTGAQAPAPSPAGAKGVGGKQGHVTVAEGGIPDDQSDPSLPGTGYPLTTFVALLALVVIAGLVLRVALPALARHRA